MPMAIYVQGPLSSWLLRFWPQHHCLTVRTVATSLPAAEASVYHSAHDSAERGPGPDCPANIQPYNTQHTKQHNNAQYAHSLHITLLYCNIYSGVYLHILRLLSQTPNPLRHRVLCNTVTPLLGITDYPRHPPNKHRTVRQAHYLFYHSPSTLVAERTPALLNR